MAGLGWFMAIIAGALAGWIAEKVMKADMGLLANIGIGILGAVVLNAILFFIGVGTLGGFFGQTIIGLVGACLLIALYRTLKGRKTKI